jgi:hypothetical protein
MEKRIAKIIRRYDGLRDFSARYEWFLPLLTKVYSHSEFGFGGGYDGDLAWVGRKRLNNLYKADGDVMGNRLVKLFGLTVNHEVAVSALTAEFEGLQESCSMHPFLVPVLDEMARATVTRITTKKVVFAASATFFSLADVVTDAFTVKVRARATISSLLLPLHTSLTHPLRSRRCTTTWAHRTTACS